MEIVFCFVFKNVVNKVNDSSTRESTDATLHLFPICIHVIFNDVIDEFFVNINTSQRVICVNNQPHMHLDALKTIALKI